MKLYRNLTGMTILVLAMICLSGINVAVAAPVAMPVISRNVPAFASSDYPASANDNSYSTSWRATIPGWIAYDLSAGGTTGASSGCMVLYSQKNDLRSMLNMGVIIC